MKYYVVISYRKERWKSGHDKGLIRGHRSVSAFSPWLNHDLVNKPQHLSYKSIYIAFTHHAIIPKCSDSGGTRGAVPCSNLKRFLSKVQPEQPFPNKNKLNSPPSTCLQLPWSIYPAVST